jgi:phosphocarrier protein
MKEFTYTITNPIGIHARPAGMLAKEAKKYASTRTVTKGDKTQKLTQLMMLMAMGIVQGDTVVVRAEGADEETAILELEQYFKANL